MSRRCWGDCIRLKGWDGFPERPFGVAPKTSDKGLKQLVLDTVQATKMTLTARISAGTGFRVVRGVFPRSFPGVLKFSAKFLENSQ